MKFKKGMPSPEEALKETGNLAKLMSSSVGGKIYAFLEIETSFVLKKEQNNVLRLAIDFLDKKQTILETSLLQAFLRSNDRAVLLRGFGSRKKEGYWVALCSRGFLDKLKKCENWAEKKKSIDMKYIESYWPFIEFIRGIRGQADENNKFEFKPLFFLGHEELQDFLKAVLSYNKG